MANSLNISYNNFVSYVKGKFGVNINKDYLSQLDYVLNMIAHGITTAPNNSQDVASTRNHARKRGLLVTDKEYRAILLKLKKDGYIDISHSIHGTEQNDVSDSFHLLPTISGLIFNRKGYRKTYRLNKITEFPKNYWYLIAIVSAIGGATFDIWKEALRQKVLPQKIEPKQVLRASSDTPVSHKTVHDTVYVKILPSEN